MTYHNIVHKYKEELVVPPCAISNNISFLTEDYSKGVITSDNKRCKVVNYEEVHLCSPRMERLIANLYNLDVWTFAKRWYNYNKNMYSMYFVYMKIEIEK